MRNPSRLQIQTSFLETSRGLVILSLVYGVLLAGVLCLGAYGSSLVTIVPGDDTGGVLFTRAIGSLAILIIVCLCGLLGYIVRNFRRGLVAFLAAETIAFLTTPFLLQSIIQHPTNESVFDALDLRLLSQFDWAGTVAVELALLITLGGIVAIGAGFFLREWIERSQSVRMDQRSVALGVLIDGVVVVWPISPPILTQNGWHFSPNLGTLAIPIMAGLLVVGSVLVAGGLFRGSKKSTLYTGPLIIGSLAIVACSIVSLNYASSIISYATVWWATSQFNLAQAQNFQTVTGLLLASLIIPAMIFLKIFFRNLRPIDLVIDSAPTIGTGSA